MLSSWVSVLQQQNVIKWQNVVTEKNNTNNAACQLVCWTILLRPARHQSLTNNQSIDQHDHSFWSIGCQHTYARHSSPERVFPSVSVLLTSASRSRHQVFDDRHLGLPHNKSRAFAHTFARWLHQIDCFISQTILRSRVQHLVRTQVGQPSCSPSMGRLKW